MDWSNNSRWNNRRQSDRISNHVEMLDLTDGKWHTIRMSGKAFVQYGYWINVVTKEGKVASFYKPCLGTYVDDQGEVQVDIDKCPYAEILELTPRAEAFVNVIDRGLQEREPRNLGRPTRYESKARTWNGFKAYFKEDKDTDMWTPMRVFRVTASPGNKISELSGLNVRKVNGEKQAYPPDHPKYGFDLMVKYNANASTPAEMYSVQKGENTALDGDERRYLHWMIPELEIEKEAEAVKEAERIKSRLCKRNGELIFPELAEEENRKSKKSGGKGGHGKYRDQFDDDDDDVEDEEENDRRRGKKSRRNDDNRRGMRSRSRRDDDYDDEDLDDDEGDEDDFYDDADDEEDDRRSQKRGKPASRKAARSKRSRRDDDYDDEGEDEDDFYDEDPEEDDEDDRRSSRRRDSRKASRSGRSSRNSGKRRRREEDLDDEIPF